MGVQGSDRISDYYSALIGMQKAFLADEKEIFEVTIKGQKKPQAQRRARWRDGDTRPIHQLAVARKIEFHAEATKYLQHRIKRAEPRADS